MPIYEFRCTGCGRRFEKLCVMGETGEQVTCPECGNRGAQRLMSGFFSRGGKEGNGDSSFASGGGSGCAGCSSSSCATCGH